MSTPTLILHTMETILNRLLALDPDSRARLAEFDGKCIAVRLAGGERDLECFVLPSATVLQLRATHERPADVVIRGDLPVFARLVFGNGAMTRAGELQISGDIDLGQRFQRLLKQIDLDWEEQAARWVGDVAAHQLGRATRGLRVWARASRGALEQDTREYLQEESRLLPPRAEVERFLRAVDILRADVDRLEQRLTHLIPEQR